jgi:hypothetical protein
MRADGAGRALTTTTGDVRRVTLTPGEPGRVTSLEPDSFEPVWTADGRWLFYRQDTGLRRRHVDAITPLTLSAPETIVPAGLVDGACGVPNYDVSADGTLVLSVHRALAAEPSRVRFILNYRPGGRRR